MHFLAEHVGETKVDELGVVVLNHLQNVSSGSHVCFSWKSSLRVRLHSRTGARLRSTRRRYDSDAVIRLLSNQRAKSVSARSNAVH